MAAFNKQRLRGRKSVDPTLVAVTTADKATESGVVPINPVAKDMARLLSSFNQLNSPQRAPEPPAITEPSRKVQSVAVFAEPKPEKAADVLPISTTAATNMAQLLAAFEPTTKQQNAAKMAVEVKGDAAPKTVAIAKGGSTDLEKLMKFFEEDG